VRKPQTLTHVEGILSIGEFKHSEFFINIAEKKDIKTLMELHNNNNDVKMDTDEPTYKMEDLVEDFKEYQKTTILLKTQMPSIKKTPIAMRVGSSQKFNVLQTTRDAPLMHNAFSPTQPQPASTSQSRNSKLAKKKTIKVVPVFADVSDPPDSWSQRLSSSPPCFDPGSPRPTRQAKEKAAKTISIIIQDEVCCIFCKNNLIIKCTL
jgi:hypothetical protein